MKWENVCRPKEFGGLGLLNTRYMNIALLLKWIWKLFNNADDAPWLQILKNKYLRNGESIPMNNSRGSQFWNGLQSVKHWFVWGAIHTVGDGRATRFWHDVWIGNVPFKLAFPSLFWAAEAPEFSVAANYDTDVHLWDVKFKRSFGVDDMQLWEFLLAKLDHVFLSDQEDRVRWALEKNGEYSSKSMYKWLSFQGVSDP